MGVELETTLVGAIIGGLVAIAIFLGQREQTKWQATMAVLAEFNSPQFLTIRSGAFTALKKCPNLNLIENEIEETVSLTMTERDHIWAILTFYARIQIMVDGGYVVRRTILLAFGEVFYWWWEVHFRHIRNASHNSELGLVQKLPRFFEQQANALGNPSLIKTWREEGRRTRERMVSKASAAL